ncbi:MAG: hypothetical protein E6R05_03525 [Candidatus Moraniibacteriota bacterium]|nr:MAG: hypothetical protein E6R05_03525 [Candidatus Moranbacteria bacterium]
MVDQELKKAILQTIKYSDHFHFPLTLTELHQRLIGYRISKSSLSASLNSLIKSNLLSQKNNYYFLPQKSTLVKRRGLYARLSIPLYTYAQSLLPTLTRISSVRGIFLTGSLAMSNTDGHDDIDLMIITASGKLWTTRLLLTVYTTLLGLRRTRNASNIMGKLCLNLYLTTSSLTIPISKRSIYSAYELIQIVPLYDPHNLHAQLLTSNPWVNDYLPNYPMPKSTTHQISFMQYPMYEKLFYHFQYLYMKPRITREYITLDAAFFHPNDPAPKV